MQCKLGLKFPERNAYNARIAFNWRGEIRMETEQASVKFSQTVTRLRETVEPYMLSFKCALAYVVELEDTIAQLCIVLQPFDVSEQHTELYHEASMGVRIYVERMSVAEAFDSLMHFARKGEITLGSSQRKFAYSSNELSIPSIQLWERKRVNVLGREWSSWGMNAYCSQTLDKLYPAFKFNKFYSILREDKGESNLQGLIFSLTHLHYLQVDSNTCPGITILSPIYARINRCGLVKDRVRFYVETVEGLAENSHLYVNVLKFGLGPHPSSLKLSLDKMKLSTIGEHGLHFLSHEMPAEGLDRVELDLKDHIGLSRSTCRSSIAWTNILQKKAAQFPRRSILISLRRVKNLTFPLAFLISVVLSVYAAWFYVDSKSLPDPIAATTAAMAIGTILMAYVSKKGLDASRSERLKPLAEEALNDFVNRLRQGVKAVIREANSDEMVSIVPEWVEPKPYLVSITFGEAPSLLRKLSKLLKSMFSYNVSVNPKNLTRLRTDAEEVLKSIDDLAAKLSQKYWAKPSSERTYFLSSCGG